MSNGTAADLDGICSLITQVKRLTLICNVFIDGFVDQLLQVDVVVRGAELRYQWQSIEEKKSLLPRVFPLATHSLWFSVPRKPEELTSHIA